MTEALGNAFKYVGLGADVFMGMYDDSKYVEGLQAKIENQQQGKAPPAAAADKGGASERSSPAPSDAPSANEVDALVEEALGEFVEGIAVEQNGMPMIEPQPDEESWGLAAKVFKLGLDFCEDFEAMASYIALNLKTLDQMQEWATGDYGDCMGALSNWTATWIGNVEDEAALTKKWSTISKKVNGMKRTMPDLYVAITDGFKSRKAAIKEN